MKACIGCAGNLEVACKIKGDWGAIISASESFSTESGSGIP